MIIVKLIFRLPDDPLDLYIYLAVHSQHTAVCGQCNAQHCFGYLSSAVPTCPSSPSLAPHYFGLTVSVWFSHCITLQNAFCCHCSLAPQPLSWLEHSPNSPYQKFLGLISPQTTNKTLGNLVTSDQGPPFQDKRIKDFPGKYCWISELRRQCDWLGSGPGSPGLLRRPLSWPSSLPDPRRIPAQAK